MKYFVILITLFHLHAFATEKRPMTVEDMWSMKRLGDIRLSPDGKHIAFSVTTFDMKKNSGQTDLWILSVDGQMRQLTTNSANDHTPRWKPDGSALAFLSNRNASTQIYLLSMSGGEAIQKTHLPVDINNFIWSPNGDRFAFTAFVHPGAESLEKSAAIDSIKKGSKIKATITDRLLFRHWNRWTEGKRSHIFVCDQSGEDVIDLTPGDFDSPPLSLGGSQDFVFSPDGQQLAFVRNTDPMVAISTNNDVFLVSSRGGTLQNITRNNKANDNQPCYSPDGKYIAYRQMERPGFESDQYDIILYDRTTGKKINLTLNFDRSPGKIIWSPNSEMLYFTAEDQGRVRIYKTDIQTNKIELIVSDHSNSDLQISPDGKNLYFTQQATNQPADIFKYNRFDKVTNLSKINEPLIKQLELNSVEDFWFTSYDGNQVHGLLVKPPFFDSTRTYPMVYLIHGGPQGMWSDEFHYRWNSSMFAAPGYVVAMVNFRGSKGYGQDWCDAVTKNWGSGPYKDLMSGVDYLTSSFSFIDNTKIVAAGASYGGYMINWIATHTDRFRALVSHAGVFDLLSKYGATEELWFPEWEFDGTPYEHPELYIKWSPSQYAENFNKFKTPTLVIHGQHDYRVPVTQGFQTFTALQRLGVPSRLIYFPDETHFVTKPQNAKLWWSEVFKWFEKWLE